MISIPKKCVNSFCLPMLGLGTYQIGEVQKPNMRNNKAQDIAGIKKAIELGFTHIDTAESYSEGLSEKIVGEAIKNFDRSQLFITTKVRRSNLRYDDVIRSAKASLDRLGIKMIDLYLIHAPSSDIPISETIKAMDFLLENELIKNVGVSNFNVEQLESVLATTKYSIVNNQIHYNLGARAFEHNNTLSFCEKQGILVTAYRIVGYEQLLPGISILKSLAAKYKKTPVQIAINWLISQPNVVGLIKSTDPEHIKENLGALGWNMEKSDVDYLSCNFPIGETINI
jgi:diketogulonate reductase-like aldo/keto reductase